MPPLNAPDSFPFGICVSQLGLVPSPTLTELFVTARSNYAWPAGQLAFVSQTQIRNLEAQGALYTAAPTVPNAHHFAVDVSDWAGNNANAHAAIIGHTPAQAAVLNGAFQNALMGNIVLAMTALAALPGISVVIASKMLRFLSPATCGAIDRHASYFTNSLPWCPPNPGFATNFLREWSNGNHHASRLAIYSPIRAQNAIVEYNGAYLPLLVGLAASMNAAGNTYLDAITLAQTLWTASDVDMAMYSWWSQNGPP